MPCRKCLALGACLWFLAGCGSTPPVPGFECLAPQDCGGSPCCWSHSILAERSSCTSSPGACVPVLGVDTITTRLCQTDADCTSGGISTTLSHCCQRPEVPNRACLDTCP
ncbi:MAG TPA: hypothetical protein VMH40_13850 [Myxococcaceae bacterium]|nr:hypothetical protein [Myxococcaceae bacterium]